MIKEMRVRSLSQEDPLEKKMATHSSVLAWRIPWTEEPGGLQSLGSQELDTTELNHHHLGGFLMLPDLGVWGLIPKEVSLPAGLPACLAPQTPCLGRRPTIRLAVLEAAHQCRDFEERATGWHGRALGFRVPDHTALPDTVEVRTCAWGSPGPPNLYTLRIPARTLQRPPPMSKLLKGTGLCHPLWDWAFCLLVPCPGRANNTPLSSSVSSRMAAKTPLWTCWAQISGLPTPSIPSGALLFLLLCVAPAGTPASWSLFPEGPILSGPSSR